MGSVSFNTAVCYKDWTQLLAGGLLSDRIDGLGYQFQEYNIFINNVPDYGAVKTLLDKVAPFANAVVSTQMEAQIKSTFNINLQSSYWYSIAPFSAILTTKCDYLFFMTPDCDAKIAKTSFFDDAMTILGDQVVIACPFWGEEITDKGGDAFFTDQIMSDQCFLAKTSFLKQDIYNEKHPQGSMYPIYAGNSFEKRIHAHMNNNGLKRAVHRHSSYKHTNF